MRQDVDADRFPQWYGPAAKAQQERQRAWHRCEGRAVHEAGQLGVDWVGTEHFLLALVAPGEESAAATALRECGADHDALLQGTGARPVIRPDRPRTFSPATYLLNGMAQGFAAGLGARRVGPEHILLALLWRPDGIHAAMLDAAGVSPAAVQRRLARLGVAVPRRPPPERDDTRWGETFTIRIPDADAWEVATRTLRLLPEGAPMRFNFGRGKARYASGEGVDLAATVRSARRQQLADRRRREAGPSARS